MPSDDDAKPRPDSSLDTAGRPQPAGGDRRQGRSGGTRSRAGSNYGDWRPHDRAVNPDRDHLDRQGEPQAARPKTGAAGDRDSDEPQTPGGGVHAAGGTEQGGSDRRG